MQRIRKFERRLIVAKAEALILGAETKNADRNPRRIDEATHLVIFLEVVCIAESALQIGAARVAEFRRELEGKTLVGCRARRASFDEFEDNMVLPSSEPAKPRAIEEAKMIAAKRRVLFTALLRRTARPWSSSFD